MTNGAKVRGLVAACVWIVGSAGCAALLEPVDGTAELGEDPRALPETAVFKLGSCDVDEMRERVCGHLNEPVDVAADAPFWDCPADPRRLSSAGPVMLFYTDTKRMEFDRKMTLRYREGLNESCGEEGERAGDCCFSRCTPLSVARRSDRGVPDGYREVPVCVDAPQGGTRYPADEAPECPAALALGMGPTPFEPDPFDAAETAKVRGRNPGRFADTLVCCYRKLEENR